jgi:hypothetical protein
MWGLFISQGCLVYTGYLYISWLPSRENRRRDGCISQQPEGTPSVVPLRSGEG